MWGNTVGFWENEIVPKKPNFPRVDFQVHVHDSNYGFEHIFMAMEARGMDVLAILSYPFQNSVVDWIFKTGVDAFYLDKGEGVYRGTSKETGRAMYLVFGHEVESSDGWHLLDIGGKIKYDINARKTIEAYIEEGLSADGLLILDHPYADPVRRFEDLLPKKEEELIWMVEEYGNKIAFEWNAYCDPHVRKISGILLRRNYGDVNSKLEELAVAEAYKLRVVTTSDTHARNRKLLNGIGAAHVLFHNGCVRFDSESALLDSMRNAILGRNYIQEKGYVPFWSHFFPAFAWPRIKEMITGRDHSV